MKNFAHYLKAEIADLEAEMRASKTYRRIEEAKRLLALYEGDEVAQGNTAETAAQPDADDSAMSEEEAEEEPASSASPSDKDPPGDTLAEQPPVTDATADDGAVVDTEADNAIRDMPGVSQISAETPSDAGGPVATDHNPPPPTLDAPMAETSAPTDAVPLAPADDPATLVQTDPRLTQEDEAPAQETGGQDGGAAPDKDAAATTDPVQDKPDVEAADPAADHAPHKEGDVIIVPPERPNPPSLSRWRW